MPKSVLLYELEKVRYLDLETFLFPVLFSHLKRLMVEIEIMLWNVCSHSEHVFETNTHCYYSMKYWRSWWHIFTSKIVTYTHYVLLFTLFTKSKILFLVILQHLRYLEALLQQFALSENVVTSQMKKGELARGNPKQSIVWKNAKFNFIGSTEETGWQRMAVQPTHHYPTPTPHPC